MTKEEVLQLEKELSFQEFNNHAAYQLGQIIVCLLYTSDAADE